MPVAGEAWMRVWLGRSHLQEKTQLCSRFCWVFRACSQTLDRHRPVCGVCTRLADPLKRTLERDVCGWFLVLSLQLRVHVSVSVWAPGWLRWLSWLSDSGFRLRL